MLKLIIGLSASVKVEGDTFVPLEEQHNVPLLAESRWRGFASALNGGFVEKLVVLGGQEKILTAKIPVEMRTHCTPCGKEGDFLFVPRGFATTEGLIKSYGVDRAKVDYRITEGNTGGNVGAIASVLEDFGCHVSEVGITTSLYHLPRAFMDFHEAGFFAIKPVPTEAFWLATESKGDRATMLNQLRDEFGRDAPLTERVVMELNGAADKLIGQYHPISR